MLLLNPKVNPSKKYKASALVSVIAFFTIFFVFCGFAIDFSMIITARSQLQNAVETTVLGAAPYISSDNAEKTAYNLFSYTKTNFIKNANITNIEIKKPANAILIEANALAQTYFLSALGIRTIEIQAQAAAEIKPIVLNPDMDLNIENHIQYISPVLIFSKEGSEIKINRSDNTSEYMVYVGLNDKINETKWVDITCSTNDINAKEQFFDFDATCIKDKYNGGITAAQQIRIINNDSSTPSDLFAIDELALNNTASLIKSSKFHSL